MINRSGILATLCVLVIGVGNSLPARADVIIDWNQTACDVVAKVGAGAPGHRMMAVAQVAVFVLKTFAMIFLLMQIRWTLPRFRFDQVLQLGWKNLLPLSLANAFVTLWAVYLLS